MGASNTKECWHNWVRIENESTSDNRKKEKCSKCGLIRVEAQNTSATTRYPQYYYYPIIKNYDATN